MKEEYFGDDEECHLKMKILSNLGFKCSTVEFNIYSDTLCLKIDFLEKDRSGGKTNNYLKTSNTNTNVNKWEIWECVLQ